MHSSAHKSLTVIKTRSTWRRLSNGKCSLRREKARKKFRRPCRTAWIPTYLSTYLPRLPSLIDVVSHTDHHPGDHLLAMSLISYTIQHRALCTNMFICRFGVLHNMSPPHLERTRLSTAYRSTYIIFRFNKISNDYTGYNIKLPIIKYWKFRIHFQTNFVLWKKVAHFHDKTYTQYSS